MSNELNKRAVEAVRKHYNCKDKYPCMAFDYCIYPCIEFDYCIFGNGINNSYNCGECGADEFYKGYMQALKNKETQL